MTRLLVTVIQNGLVRIDNGLDKQITMASTRMGDGNLLHFRLFGVNKHSKTLKCHSFRCTSGLYNRSSATLNKGIKLVVNCGCSRTKQLVRIILITFTFLSLEFITSGKDWCRKNRLLTDLLEYLPSTQDLITQVMILDHLYSWQSGHHNL